MLIVLVQSCAVTNTFYDNDPTPLTKGESEGTIGLSTGIYAAIDDVDTAGNISYSNKYKVMPNVNINLLWGVGDRTNLNVAVQLPAVVLGVGAKVGVQHSFLSESSSFNIAPKFELGFSASKNNVSLGDLELYSDVAVRTPITYVDLSLPMSYNVGKHSRLILAPRFSIMKMGVYRNTFYKTAKIDVNSAMLVLSAGFKYKHLLVEASALRTTSFGIVPTIGVGYTSLTR